MTFRSTIAHMLTILVFAYVASFTAGFFFDGVLWVFASAVIGSAFGDLAGTLRAGRRT